MRKNFRLSKLCRDIFRKKYDVIDIDGARILMPGGWGLVRASNTQPVLVLRFEADTPERLEAIRHEVEAEVKKRCTSVDFLHLKAAGQSVTAFDLHMGIASAIKLFFDVINAVASAARGR